MVLVVGKGEGDKYDPAMERAGKRTGEASISNCTFANSESGGVVLQNLHKAEIANSEGQYLDALLNASWCDKVVGAGCIGEGFNSDGTYITSCQDVILENWQIKTARQGFDLQGVAKAVLTNCTAFDCAKAFELTMSETDKKTVSVSITLLDCDSKGCLIPFSIGGVRNLSVTGGNNDEIGEWLSLYQAGDFLHTDGIVDAVGLSQSGRSIFEYDPSFLDTPLDKSREFSNVNMRLSKNIGPDYQVIQAPGVYYTKA
ncbi:MAG: right-handed parallel beta-helix repeat-containing protein [Candidatus Levybacteria bacterium]|nr:right-handed parallel beta-helix repeat-containing protein [Candidatus Levybacteria bacterium]